MLADLLLIWVCSHLLKHQRPEQSGFTSSKSTTDLILVLCVLVDHQCEFQQGILAAYVDLKVFNSVLRETFWDPLRLHGIPARIIDLLTGLYSETMSAIKCGGGVPNFPVNTGVW